MTPRFYCWPRAYSLFWLFFFCKCGAALHQCWEDSSFHKRYEVYLFFPVLGLWSVLKIFNDNDRRTILNRQQNRRVVWSKKATTSSASRPSCPALRRAAGKPTSTWTQGSSDARPGKGLPGWESQWSKYGLFMWWFICCCILIYGKLLWIELLYDFTEIMVSRYLKVKYHIFGVLNVDMTWQIPPGTV